MCWPHRVPGPFPGSQPCWLSPGPGSCPRLQVDPNRTCNSLQLARAWPLRAGRLSTCDQLCMHARSRPPGKMCGRHSCHQRATRGRKGTDRRLATPPSWQEEDLEPNASCHGSDKPSLFPQGRVVKCRRTVTSRFPAVNRRVNFSPEIKHLERPQAPGSVVCGHLAWHPSSCTISRLHPLSTSVFFTPT